VKSDKRTTILGGISRLPRELSSGESFQVILELDPDQGKVLEASCSPCPPVVENFLRGLFIGTKLETEVEYLLHAIDQRVILKSKKAILAAVRDLVKQYEEQKLNFEKPHHETHETH
jgi:hypothetical protein